MSPNEHDRAEKREAREIRHAEKVLAHEAHAIEREEDREYRREHDHHEHPHERHEHHEHHEHEDAVRHAPREVRYTREAADPQTRSGRRQGNHQGCAIVTGSGQGIGAAIARRLAADGFPIVLNCPNEALLGPTHEVAQALKAEHDARVITIIADVSDMDQVKAMVDEAVAEFGAVDVLVNNAGITRDKLIARMSPADFNDVISINLNGTFHCCKAVTRPMMKQRYGRIISLSSVVGVHGNAGQANYAASKAGIIGLTKSLAKELAPRNITVNAIAPGFIQSPMTDALTPEQRDAIAAQIGLGRFGTPEDVANLVSFLASDEASYITGQVIGIDGGMGA